MFLKPLTLSVLISSLVLVEINGEELAETIQIPENEVSSLIPRKPGQSYFKINIKKASHDADVIKQDHLSQQIANDSVYINDPRVHLENWMKAKSEIDNLVNSTISQIENLQKKLSLGDEYIKRIELEEQGKSNKSISPKEFELLKSNYEQRITALETENKDLYGSKSVLENKVEQLIRNLKFTKLESSCAEKESQDVRNLLKTEQADPRFKVKLALKLDRNNAECSEAKNVTNKIPDIRKKYRLFTDFKTWPDAQKACTKAGMYLPVIISEEEEKVLAEMLKGSKDDIPDTENMFEAWIGVYRINAEWLAISGEPLIKVTSYINWDPHQPDNSTGKCVALMAKQGMDDAPCRQALPYFCKHFTL